MCLSWQMITLQISISIISVLFGIDPIKNPLSSELISNPEKMALAQLRVLVADVLEKDYEKTDENLILWLREKDMNVNAANEMIRNAKKWRKYNKIDSILNETLAELRPGSPVCNTDVIDKEGIPVLTCETSGIDLRKLVVSGRSEHVTRYYTYWMERVQREARVANQKMGKSIRPIIISNAEGFNVKQHGCYSCMKYNHETVVIARSYYPEASRCMIVINVPTIAMGLVETIKSFMSERSRKRLNVFGTDKEKWSRFLLNLIPSNQLPKAYGGTK